MATKNRPVAIATETNMQDQTMFKQLFHAKEATVKGQQESIVERKLQRKLQSAYDDALSKKESMLEQILNERSRLSDMNINTIISHRAEIEAIEKAMEAISQEYQTLFGEDLDR